jgi:hypothetical protein
VLVGLGVTVAVDVGGGSVAVAVEVAVFVEAGDPDPEFDEPHAPAITVIAPERMATMAFLMFCQFLPA